MTIETSDDAKTTTDTEATESVVETEGSFSARVIMDSSYEDQCGVNWELKTFRLTTLEVVIPQIILAEFNTHHLFSRNSASTRAIPVEKMIERVMTNPFIPTRWPKNERGMMVREYHAEHSFEHERSETQWLRARDSAVAAVRVFSDPEDLDVHKGIASRLLEAWMWHTVIVSSTEWTNWNALRDDPGAQLEIQVPARLMARAMERSKPFTNISATTGKDWHLPFAEERRSATFTESKHHQMVSTGRCAAVSFMRHMQHDEVEDQKRGSRIVVNGHMSPTEHVARAMTEEERRLYARYWDVDENGRRVIVDEEVTKRKPVRGHHFDVDFFCGNFQGWMQFRKTLPNEHDYSLIKASRGVK